jgi:uncharacterized damage-inducible protein DinB
MRKLLLINAKFNQEADKAVYTLLSGLSNEEREKDRGNYFHSLSGIALHVLGGALSFHGLFRSALGDIPAAKALSYPAITLPKEGATEADWKQAGSYFDVVDEATVQFASALRDTDLERPIKVDWFGGNPASAPLYFMFNHFITHGTHHRGEISQILDSLHIENDYSGVNIAFLP